MDSSSPTGTIIFDRDDHPMWKRVRFIQYGNGDISVSCDDHCEEFSRMGLLLTYRESRGRTTYAEAFEEFFCSYFTEAEWTLAALST